jgi:glycosyltransferase involved in cell wall biosynthesis
MPPLDTQSITVVMPTRNRVRFIADALDSLMRQTSLPKEVIVVDDASADGTCDVVRRHPLAPSIHYVRHESPRGASNSRNEAAQLATGDTIVFLDSDDTLSPDHHESLLRIFSSNPAIGLVCCDALTIDAAGRPLSPGHSWTSIQCEIKNWSIQSGVRPLTDIFLFSTCFPGMAVRRDVYLGVGGLVQDLFPLDDWDLQLKVAASGALVHYEHRPLAHYRVHGANESGAAQGVRVGEKKLACVQLAVNRYPPIAALGVRAKVRRGEVRRELAIELLRSRRLVRGTWQIVRSLIEDPEGGINDIRRILRRRVRRAAAEK